MGRGYGDGLLRASPHEEVGDDGPGPRGCWCHDNYEWAPEALELPPVEANP